MLSDDRIAIWQLTNTILPLVACCIALSYSTQSFSLLSGVLSPLLFVLVVLFLSRSFSLMHDCGHLSLFRSKRANRIAAFALRIFHAMPHYPWSRGHDFHHKYNGNWDQYRGPSALTTVEKYQEKSGFSKACYRVKASLPVVSRWILLSCDQAKSHIIPWVDRVCDHGFGGLLNQCQAVLLGVIHLFPGNSFTRRVRLMMHWLIRWCYLVRGI